MYSGVYLVHAFKCTPLEVGVKGNTSPPPSLTFSLREVECLRRSKTIEKRHPRTAFFYGRGERTQTFDLSVPNRARYQLRHTPIGVLEKLYTSFNDLTRGVGRLYIVGQHCHQPQTALRASSCRVSFRRSSRARQFCRLPILVWR